MLLVGILCLILNAVTYKEIIYSNTLLIDFNLHDLISLGNFEYFLMTSFALYQIYWLSLSIIILYPIFLLAKTKTHLKTLEFLSIFLSSLWIIYTIVDKFVFQNFQFHLNLYWIKLFLSSDVSSILRPSKLEVMLTISAVGFIFIINFILFKIANALAITSPQLQKCRWSFCWFWGFIIIWFFLHLLTTMMDNEKFILSQMDYYPGLPQVISFIEKKSNNQTISKFHGLIRAQHNKKIKYPADNLLRLNTSPQKYNILWIVVDTLRYDAISPTLTPNLIKFQKQNLNFINHQSSGNSTQAGIFGMFYGLPPNYFPASIQYHQQPLLFNLLEKAGYQFKIFFSGNLQSPPWNLNLFHKRKTSEIPQHNSEDPGLDDQKTTQDLIHFLNNRTPESKPFFSYFYLSSVHDYCAEQTYPQFYLNAQAPCNRLVVKSYDKYLLQQRYKNAVHYTDSLLGKLFTELDKSGLLNNTIVIFTSDHGESFNEYNNNIWRHCRGYFDTLIHVPLIIHWPYKGRLVTNKQTTHYDLSATLMKYFSHQKLEQKYTIGYNLFHPKERPFMISGSYINSALITHDMITIFHPNGKLELFNTKGKPIQHTTPNTKHITSALNLMAKFYEE